MQKIITATQTRQADQFTIANEPISSVGLMERATKSFVVKFMEEVPAKNIMIAVYCGTGNNGGDGLAIARLLSARNYTNVKVVILQHSFKTSPEFDENFRSVQKLNLPVHIIQSDDELPAETSEIIIDAVLGSGLNKPLEGILKQWIDQLNALHKKVIAVDIPTGMFADEPNQADSTKFKADLVITFQRPKLNFLLPESALVMKSWEAVDIGLDEHFIQSCESELALIEEKDIRLIFKKRENFSHKGTFGHSLIIAGKDETMGAALLTAEACLNTGSGLTTAFIPPSGLIALNTRLPEVMAGFGEPGWQKYSALAIGPGLGTDDPAVAVLKNALKNFRGPCVFDADALNMLASDKSLFDLVPEQSILTPHVKEFDRLFGSHKNWNHRIKTMQQEARERELIIVLKNRYTIIALPTGMVYFNLTGTPAMASGGMGDVLTGIIVALLAQGYSAIQAAMAGVYLHGKAGNELEELGYSVIRASELAKQVSKTIFNFK
ncbi:bifunctional ADP-dependent NAD(P)H-hydrate dehydratase/NAD(P)H-hydrate epimerase [Solitalea longa]|uniref:Bifunctional NAD(P)H-hydrate repair enzyme n=1 Tax=Solitalea longa TaxID=2079460 RepID=A0A2S5AAQ9_9SPHI|nr:NAD(P)H-hydrate dehydratase [Solitalea longa]POY39317.1 bifunctional ADP-dependent NAD(P)H-hydrate dehydratase/NAD(P)H-hydrate epimerase [Solitalea longa]